MERFGRLGEKALVLVVHVGYVEPGVASTVVLVLEGERAIVIDPGMVSSPDRILEPLRGLGLAPERVTDVVLSHHHPDHTMHVALFPEADVHDYMAIYRGDSWTVRPADGFHPSPSVALMSTPGHSREDVTVLIDTTAGLVAYTHLWWHERGPLEDPYAPNPRELEASRRRLLGLSPAWIIPAHGAPFRPSPTTPGG